MTTHPTDDLLQPPRGGVLQGVARQVDLVLAEFLTRRAADLSVLDPALAPVSGAVRSLVEAGGKRLRPAFVWWGYRAAGGDGDPRVLKPAGAVELLHTFALIHDDIMDRSATRRGLPAVHAALAEHHQQAGLDGDADWFGVGGGILAGDMVFVWADMLFEEAGTAADDPMVLAGIDAPAMARARHVFAHLRAEVMAGQYLDLRLSGMREASLEDSLRVSLLKSGRYTVTRPLQMGAALGGTDAELDATLTAFGDAVGVAFQLRDDVLGLLGDPDATGKGALEDVREGKRTMLVLRARSMATPAQRAQMDRVIGNATADAADVDIVRQIVQDTGAADAVEQQVGKLRTQAEVAAQDIPTHARTALLELADVAIDRTA